jgi:pilus assembly protein Flp/PilA
MMNRIAVLKTRVVGWFRRRLIDEAGASLVEYALLLALIAIIAIAALVFLGHSAANVLNNVANNINNPG